MIYLFVSELFEGHKNKWRKSQINQQNLAGINTTLPVINDRLWTFTTDVVRFRRVYPR